LGRDLSPFTRLWSAIVIAPRDDPIQVAEWIIAFDIGIVADLLTDAGFPAFPQPRMNA